MANALFGVVLAALIALPAQAATTAAKPPAWAEMSPQDQQVLAPLESRWSNFTPQRKRMWLGIAQKYPTMPPEEQAKVQRRLEYWVKLSQAERRTVREGYKDLQKLPMWDDEYNKTLIGQLPDVVAIGYPGPTTLWALESWRTHMMAELVNKVLVESCR